VSRIQRERAIGATAVVLYRAVRGRRRTSRAIAWLLTAGVALHASIAGGQSLEGFAGNRFLEQREHFSPEGGEPIELKFLTTSEAAGQTARLVNGTHAALTLLASWFGPLRPPAMIVAGVPSHAGARSAWQPGVVTAPLRWLTPVRDQSTERELIAEIVRQYWGSPASSTNSFEEALILYTSTRATDHQLEGSNFATLRFFGGFVPFPLRSVLLSPPIGDPRPRALRFDEPEHAIDAEVLRGLRALQTLERYVGWPTMLEALMTMRTAAVTYDPRALADALSDARGADIRFLVIECFREEAIFDYAVAGLESHTGASGLVESTVTIVRQGPGLFTTRTGSGTAVMPMRIRFADGTEFRDFFDGAAPSTSLVYSAKTAATSAAIDPDVMLLLDVDRENNAIVRDAPTSPLGIRLALNWIAWLQNTMLSYTAIV
jgi:hypothetical protein